MGLNLDYIEKLVGSIIGAAPAIVSGIETATPFVEAIVNLVKQGGEPSEADWAALKARLDAGSAELQSAAAEADQDSTQGMEDNPA